MHHYEQCGPISPSHSYQQVIGSSPETFSSPGSTGPTPSASPHRKSAPAPNHLGEPLLSFLHFTAFPKQSEYELSLPMRVGLKKGLALHTKIPEDGYLLMPASGPWTHKASSGSSRRGTAERWSCRWTEGRGKRCQSKKRSCLPSSAPYKITQTSSETIREMPDARGVLQHKHNRLMGIYSYFLEQCWCC